MRQRGVDGNVAIEQGFEPIMGMNEIRVQLGFSTCKNIHTSTWTVTFCLGRWVA